MSVNPVYRLQRPTGDPATPTHFSYSMLSEVEVCPRRWWLVHARYDTGWSTYPQPPTPAAVFGTIVHGTLEAFAAALRRAGHPPAGSTEFVAVRRSFPLRTTVHALRNQALDRLNPNPRADRTVIEAGVSVDDCLEVFKRLVRHAYPGDGSATRYDQPHAQAPARGAAATPRAPGEVRAGSANERVGNAAPAHPVGLGPEGLAVPIPALLPEIKITLADPPLRGTLDLVATGPDGDSLIEFKTGAPKPEHEDQTRFYGVLWWAKTGRCLRERQLVYRGRAVDRLPGLEPMQLAAELALLRERTVAAQRSLSERPPPARPNAASCQFCSVRQLCDAYWASGGNARVALVRRRPYQFRRARKRLVA